MSKNMMGEASEQVEEFGALEDLANENQEVQAEEPAEVSQEDDDIPEKYRGKSAKEIARMHQEAEKALGRQGSEVGELRRIVDQFIQSQTAKEKEKTPEIDEDVDFFADPQQAIEKAISKHPKVKEAEAIAAQMKKAEALATLKTKHPDFMDIVQDKGFADWVIKSKVRQELFVRADQQFDYEAADELLSLYKERAQVINQTKANEQTERKQALRAASTGSTRGSAEPASQKIYRRADIIELMRTNPERYQELQPEIMRAYAERRVR